jgi:hypothetical protein
MRCPSVDAADGGWALRYAEGSAPVRHPILTTVTSLKGRNSDISIWSTHARLILSHAPQLCYNY